MGSMCCGIEIHGILGKLHCHVFGRLVCVRGKGAPKHDIDCQKGPEAKDTDLIKNARKSISQGDLLKKNHEMLLAFVPTP